MANYTSTYSCVDTANSDAVVASGTGTSVNLVFPGAPPPADETGADVDCVFTNTPVSPGITVVKSSTTPDFSASGQSVSYQFVVTDSGDTSLSDVSVADYAGSSASGTLLSAPTCVSLSSPAGSCSGTTASLVAGQSATFTATYSTTSADVTAKDVTDTATAMGTPPTPPGGTTPPPLVSPPSTVTVPYAAITVVKSTTTTSVIAVGQVITYDFNVTNTGATSLSGVAVADYAGSSASGSLLPAPVCPSSALAAGASETCTSTYTTTQADMNAGSVVDTATVTGLPPTPPGAMPPLPVVSNPSTVNIPVLVPPAAVVPATATPSSLAYTGIGGLRRQLSVGGVLLVGGAFLVAATGRRRRRLRGSHFLK